MTRIERREYWRKNVEGFTASGLSVREFSRQRDLPYHLLLRWRKEFSVSEGLAPRFTEILPMRKLSLSSGNLQIELDGDLDFHLLSRVIGALCEAART